MVPLRHSPVDHLEALVRRRKHFFVLSNSGKPVFTRYGDEEDIVPAKDPVN
jgi:hypothetical protein